MHLLTYNAYNHNPVFGGKSHACESNSILFGVLAAEFSVESKNINRFAGERLDLKKEGTTWIEYFKWGTPLEFLKNVMMLPTPPKTDINYTAKNETRLN